MALEVRLRDDARLTKDLDLGLRDDDLDPVDLHERVIASLDVDADGDRFQFTVTPPQPLAVDDAGQATWRLRVAASLAGRPFGAIQLDISPRGHELTATDRVVLRNTLSFADVPDVEVEVIDVHRHAAEKLHAMSRVFEGRENSRIRDLVDVVLLVERGLVVAADLAEPIRAVWLERDQTSPPTTFPPLPESWPARYERSVEGLDLATLTFPAAEALIVSLWTDTLSPEES
jgi:hypothetical protein